MDQLGFDFTPAVCSVDSCDAPRTHAACGEIGPLNFDGTPNVRQGSARVECCLWHANYFANAWCPYYPFEMGSAWLETLSTPSLQSNVPG